MSSLTGFGTDSAFPPLGIAHQWTMTVTRGGVARGGIPVAIDDATVEQVVRDREVMDGSGRIIGFYYYDWKLMMNLPFYILDSSIVEARRKFEDANGSIVQARDRVTFTKIGSLAEDNFYQLTLKPWNVKGATRTQTRDGWQTITIRGEAYELF